MMGKYIHLIYLKRGGGRQNILVPLYPCPLYVEREHEMKNEE